MEKLMKASEIVSKYTGLKTTFVFIIFIGFAFLGYSIQHVTAEISSRFDTQTKVLEEINKNLIDMNYRLSTSEKQQIVLDTRITSVETKVIEMDKEIAVLKSR